ncbi:sulfur carrier protein ThiS [Plastorhodobacter daqingensis]|uniref:Sulfur carrier protein ThiS n=1 Tax=Plastorhodobacter daqingensis TaxID=1387281 RepID=A0ABW2UJ48_9RHOB
MKIEVNGAPQTVSATTLAALLVELDLAEARVATAVNGQFVPAAGRVDQPLSEGDRIEILSPMQGG